jgi:hypothetical protein
MVDITSVTGGRVIIENHLMDKSTMYKFVNFMELATIKNSVRQIESRDDNYLIERYN